VIGVQFTVFTLGHASKLALTQIRLVRELR